MSQPLQPWSPFTKKVFEWVHKIGLPLIHILAILGAIIAALFVRRQTLRYEPQLWNVIRGPLLISVVITGILFWSLAISTIAMMGEPNYLEVLLYALLYLLIGAGIYSIGLHYKKLLAWHRIQTFIIGFLIGCIFFVLAFSLFRLGTELLLRRDPAYVATLNRLAELKSKSR